MTQHDNQLDPELIWAADGCLTETAIDALADGEIGVVPGAAEHAASCDYCTAKVGSAALLSLEIATALSALPQTSSAPARVTQPKTIPIGALALAVSVAFLALSPNLAKFAVHIGSVPTSLPKLLPLLAQVIARLGSSLHWLGEQYQVHFAAAVLLTACGAIIARFAPHKLTQQGAS
jgi:hypothetical protein